MQSEHESRRDWLKMLAAGGTLGVSALLAGCAAEQKAAGGKRRRLRAAFSNAGLAGTWNKLGYDAAMLWGDLLDVDIVWFDGEFNGQTQRERIELATAEDWDFCAFQAHQIDILAEPVKRLKARGIPVIGMDTLIVAEDELFDTGVPVYICPDHVKMAEQVTRYMVEKIGGKGKVIHIGGQSEHSGAQDRAKGFQNVIRDYPDIEVVGGGVRWCDWQTEKARNTFELLLQQAGGPVAGAFCHNDDMALACAAKLPGTPHENMVVVGVDGQLPGLTGVRDGLLGATSVNPAGMIHMYAVAIGQFIVRNGESFDKLLKIVTPCPLVSREEGNLDALLYLSDPKHCLI
ncbi:MAG: ABC transporter substrate-binding protein [Planctomycetota bacterium]|nr:MAG: ABC transporter substrate-binding protein [Planctomycetota bacterium]